MVNPVIAVPAVSALVYRAWSRKTLTPTGILAAFVTAIIHVLHPWIAPFLLLTVFYLGGSQATKVKHDIKAQLTLSASGAAGGEDARTHVQVFANSIVATVLLAVHTYMLWNQGRYSSTCFAPGADTGDILIVGVIANYAAVAADTFSSELGILSKSPPRLITSPTLRVVPPGTNGGVTLAGLLAGVLGAFSIAVTAVMFVPFCAGSWSIADRGKFVVAVTLCGTFGSLLDSILGGLLQASVVDKRSGKVVEGEGGRKVLIQPGSITSAAGSSDASKFNSDIHTTESIANTISSRAARSKPASSPNQATTNQDALSSRKIESGVDLLDNNAVNVLMAALTTACAMLFASYYWSTPLSAAGIFT